MARIPMITRTIKTTEVTVMALDISTKETVTKTVTLPRTYKDDAAMLKVAAPLIETETIKPVHVVSSEVKEKLYGMSELDFVQHAKPIEKKSADAVDADNG